MRRASHLVPRADVVRGLRHGAAMLGEDLPRVGAQLDEVVGERHERGHGQRRGEERHVAELHDELQVLVEDAAVLGEAELCLRVRPRRLLRFLLRAAALAALAAGRRRRGRATAVELLLAVRAPPGVLDARDRREELARLSDEDLRAWWALGLGLAPERWGSG